MSRSVFSFLGRWFPKFQSSSSSNGGSSSSKHGTNTWSNIMLLVVTDVVVTEALIRSDQPGDLGPLSKCNAYHELFQECVNVHGIGDRLCQIYKRQLVSDCNAIWDGSTIQFPVDNDAARKNKSFEHQLDSE